MEAARGLVTVSNAKAGAQCMPEVNQFVERGQVKKFFTQLFKGDCDLFFVFG